MSLEFGEVTCSYFVTSSTNVKGGHFKMVIIGNSEKVDFDDDYGESVLRERTYTKIPFLAKGALEASQH